MKRNIVEGKMESHDDVIKSRESRIEPAKNDIETIEPNSIC